MASVNTVVFGLFYLVRYESLESDLLLYMTNRKLRQDGGILQTSLLY
jgi:hypothetical protein